MVWTSEETPEMVARLNEDIASGHAEMGWPAYVPNPDYAEARRLATMLHAHITEERYAPPKLDPNARWLYESK